MGTGVEFLLLGPVQVSQDGQPVPLDGPQQRCVLAMLLLEPGRVVPIDRLVHAVWGQVPPSAARNAIHGLIARLRRRLPDTPEVRLETTAPGYLLRVDPDRVDLHRFRALVGTASASASTGDEDTAVSALRQALALWRGPALADTGSDWMREHLVPALDTEHLATQHDRIEADLRLGRHRDLVAELSTLVAANPTRERFAAQLMLALYCNGQPTDALEVFHRTRRHLTEDLGLDPGPQLLNLHQAILRNDPLLGAPSGYERKCGCQLLSHRG